MQHEKLYTWNQSYILQDVFLLQFVKSIGHISPLTQLSNSWNVIKSFSRLPIIQVLHRLAFLDHMFDLHNTFGILDSNIIHGLICSYSYTYSLILLQHFWNPIKNKRSYFFFRQVCKWFGIIAQFLSTIFQQSFSNASSFPLQSI